MRLSGPKIKELEAKAAKSNLLFETGRRWRADKQPDGFISAALAAGRAHLKVALDEGAGE